MSLKAKVEAVVYAAEEPVTLAQLATIFSAEVLEELQMAGEAPPPAEHESSPLFDHPMDHAPDSPGAQLSAQGPEDPANQSSTPAEADEKRAARQRDRQVRDALQKVLNQLAADYASPERGIEIREIAGGYRMATKPEYHDAVRGLVKSLKPPMKLSLQALETLAVIAYKQPVTGPEISEIRGVDSGGVLGGLLSRKLIVTAGRKHVIGRPILYKTTKEFLLRFGLKDLDDLPSMEEFEKMAEELAEKESEAEEAAMRSSASSLREAGELSFHSNEVPNDEGDEEVPPAGSGTGAAFGEGAAETGPNASDTASDVASDAPSDAFGAGKTWQ